MTRAQRNAWAALLVAGCGPSTTADVEGIRSLELLKVAALNYENRDCRIAGTTSGASSFVPPLTARCVDGPGKQCEVSSSPRETWEYAFPPDDPAWLDWESLGYLIQKRTHFHKQFRWELADGVCRFTAAAYADLDDDHVYSTYESIEIFRPGGQVDFQINEHNEE